MNTSRANVLRVRSSSLAATSLLARRLGELLRGGEFIALTGDLGAGKTHFVKGLAGGLLIDPGQVTSPTFLLIHVLEGRLPLVHMDAYRVKSGEELVEAGGDDLLDGRSVVAVEWAENVPDFIPDDALHLEILVVGEFDRVLEFRAGGPSAARLLEGLGPEKLGPEGMGARP